MGNRWAWVGGEDERVADGGGNRGDGNRGDGAGVMGPDRRQSGAKAWGWGLGPKGSRGLGELVCQRVIQTQFFDEVGDGDALD